MRMASLAGAAVLTGVLVGNPLAQSALAQTAGSASAPQSRHESKEAVISEPQVVRAIQKFECYREYWGGKHRGGTVLSAKFVSEGPRAYARIDGFEPLPLKGVTFLSIRALGDRAVVAGSEGFFGSYQTNVRYIEDDGRLKFSYAKSVPVKLARDCGFPSGQTSGTKFDLLRRIGESIYNEVGNAKIIIADFDIDYPETYVLVKVTGEVWEVGLQPEDDPAGGKGTPLTTNPVRLVNDPEQARALRKTIVRRGIARETGVHE